MLYHKYRKMRVNKESRIWRSIFVAVPSACMVKIMTGRMELWKTILLTILIEYGRGVPIDAL